MRVAGVGFLVLVTACSEQGLTVHNAVPSAQIASHHDGDRIAAGIEVQLVGVGADPDGRDQVLTGTWDIDGAVACPESPTDEIGSSTCAFVFDPGSHSITFTVRDERGAAASEVVSVTAVANDAPTVVIEAPTEGQRFYADDLVPLQARVADPDGDVADLELVWTSSLTGALSGDAVSLPEGAHVLTATVTDLGGGVGSDSVSIDVGPANTAPDCAIVAPVDGSASPVGATVSMVGVASDPDQTSDTLSIAWASDRDGPLPGPLETSAALSDGTHVLTLEVTDERGATCIATTLHTLGSPPTLTLTSPADGAVFAEGAAIAFAGTVSDGEDAPADLAVDWSTDLDGTFSSQGADTAGQLALLEAGLSRGQHRLTVTATDSDGFYAQAIRTFHVDGVPTAPTVSLSPATPITTDTLQSSIDVASSDPDGDPLTYRYEWLRSGSPTAETASTVGPAATTAGDVWTLRVYASDGLLEGPPGSATVTVENAPPEITGITMTPDPARTTDAITCAATTSDADGDAVLVTWAFDVDGVPAGTTATLAASATARDDVVRCTATPSDGADVGTPLSASLIVDNTPPTAPTVDLTPAAPSPDDDLVCQIATPGADVDGDAVTYTLTWERDGLPWGGATATTVLAGDTIPSAQTANNQAWTCIATPTDGTDTGPSGEATVAVACTVGTWMPDSDADGFGDSGAATAACTSPGAGYTLVAGDCDDADPTVNPAATEWCDTIDNDCDTLVDEPQAADAPPWYLDADGDGFGNAALSTPGCSQPVGYVADDTDCDDTDGGVFPLAGDVAFDGVDSDCDGMDCEAGVDGGTYFAVCFDAVGWHDGRLDCLLAGYDDLASIRTSADQAFVELLLADAGATSTHSPWIGYADEVIEGLWGWSDLSTATYTSWGPGEPNGGNGEDCAELNWPLGSGLWNDQDCYDATSARRSFVCEIR